MPNLVLSRWRMQYKIKTCTLEWNRSRMP